MKPLPRAFYNRDTISVAKDLLGLHLVHRFKNSEKIGKIVEVEAYLGKHDLASHSSKGLTKRTATLLAPLQIKRADKGTVHAISGSQSSFKR